MAKKLISFLGTNAYLHTIYTIDNFKSEPVRYIQEALAKYQCQNWDENDEIIIFATTGENGSIVKNWESGQLNTHDKYGLSYEKEAKGLKEILDSLNLKCNITMVPIPDGILENEIWKIIENIDNVIEQNDELYIDITHSFRYIPMIIPAMITFLKTTKNITLKAIYYGAFEVLGSPFEITKLELEKREAPIRELTELYKMIEWSEATNAFLKYGSGKRLINQVNSIDKKDMDKSSTNILRALTSKVKKVDNALKFNNIQELNKDKIEIEKRLDTTKHPNLFALKKLAPLLEDYLTMWSDDELKNGLNAAKWSLENDRFAQALTFSQEALISYFCKLFPNWDSQNIEHRSSVSFVIQIALGKKEINEHSKKDKSWFKDNIDDILLKLSEIDREILEDFLKINYWRNIVNHAKQGDRKNMQKEFPSILDNLIKYFSK